MEIVKGYIVDIDEGEATIKASLPSIDHAIKRQYNEVVVGFEDGRRLSPEQRRKIYALIGEIADYMGEAVESAKEQLKLDFILHRLQDIERQMFSLANCPMELATRFIDFLISFIIENDIPTKFPLVEQCEDIARYVYATAANKKCAVCGRPGELHHVDRVGMGRNRDEINQLGMKVMCLCRLHHGESHHLGEKDFCNKYHLEPVKLDEKLGKVYRLTKRNLKTE